MPRSRLSRPGAALLCALITLLAAGVADGALVRVNGIVLHTDGGFQPQSLPRHRFAPIDFQGFVDISAMGGGQPPALQQAVLDFDRDGRLSPAGLPTCSREQVAAAGPAEARRTCAGAIVGRGRIQASVDFFGVAIAASSPLTVFNGPPEAGHPTALLHAQMAFPVAETFAIPVPIERRPGPFRYRATVDVPAIAGGLGAITRVQLKIGRRFGAGKRRSYVSAHCSDGILQTHGRFTFAEGTVIDGAVEKFCAQRR